MSSIMFELIHFPFPQTTGVQTYITARNEKECTNIL